MSFARSSLVSTVLGVNCASAATKLTLAGMMRSGIGSRMMRASSPIVVPAGVRRRKEDRHIDVGEIEDGDDRRARGDDLARAGELVLHPTVSRRNERQILDDRLDPLDLRLGVLDLRLRLVALGGEARHRRDRQVEVALALVVGLLGDVAVLDELRAALEVALREFERALARGDFRLCGGSRVLRALHVRLRRAKLRLVFRRGDAGDDLPLGDVRPFLDRDLLEPAGVFRGHVDLCRLDAAVGLDNAGRQGLAPQAGDEVLDEVLGVRGAHERQSASRVGDDAERQGDGAHQGDDSYRPPIDFMTNLLREKSRRTLRSSQGPQRASILSALY